MRPESSAREVVRQRADVLRDRHVVVVQDDEQVDVEAAGVVQRFPGEARAHRAVADHRDHAPVAAGEAVRDRHAERGADRGARMADAEAVVDALGARREGREAAALLDAAEPPPAAGQHLVRIGLVADVPDQAVVGRVEDVVERDRELDRAEAGGEVPAQRARRSRSGTGAARPTAAAGRCARSARRSAGVSIAASKPSGLRSAMAAVYWSAGRRAYEWRRSVSGRAGRGRRQSPAARDASGPKSASAAMPAPASSAARGAGRGDAGDGRVSRLAAQRVGARDLAGHRGIAEHVEQVVHDLEAEADRARRSGRAPRASRAGSAGSAAQAIEHRGPDQRAGLERVHVLDLARLEAGARSRRGRAPVRPPCRACRSRARAGGSSRCARRRRCPASASFASRSKASTCSASPARIAVASSKARCVVGPAAPQVVVVHRGQVVVHERIGVDELDRGGRRVERFRRDADRARRSRRRAAAGSACPRRARHSAWRRAGARGSTRPRAGCVEHALEALAACRLPVAGRREGLHRRSRQSASAASKSCSRSSPSAPLARTRIFCSAWLSAFWQQARQHDAALELAQGLLEREFALFEPRDDGLELREGRLEVGCGLFLSGHALHPPRRERGSQCSFTRRKAVLESV